MWTLRKAGENDAADIAALEETIFPDPWTQNSIRETLLQSNTEVSCVWNDRELIGYVILYYVLDEGEIARIAVKSSYRRQGAAGQLLEQVLRVCKDKGIVRLMLEVRESNEAAVSFYKKHGFTEDGARKGYYTNPREDALLLSMRVEIG